MSNVIGDVEAFVNGLWDKIGHSSLGERLKFEPAKFRRRRSFYGRIILNAATSISEHDEALRNIR